MEFLELPSTLLSWVDAAVRGVLPAAAVVVLWGAVGAAASLAIYAACAPQRRIAENRERVEEARRRLDAHDADFASAVPLLRSMLRLAARQVRLTAGPAVLASLPLLPLLVWMSTAYEHVDPIAIGPGWARSWELPFFASLVLGSVAIKRAFRIE